MLCQCDYPIHVSISWDAQEQMVLLRDGALLS
jgi:hypothetical protein